MPRRPNNGRERKPTRRPDRWVGNQNVRVAQWRGVAHDVGVSMLAKDGMDAGRSVAEIRALPGVNHLPSKAVHRLMARITKNDSAIPAPHGMHGNNRRRLRLALAHSRLNLSWSR